MNTPFLTIRMVLITSFFFTQQICGMQWLRQWLHGKPTQEKQFKHFPQLPEDVQLLVIGYSVKDSDSRANLQYVNKQWSEVVSIKNQKIFDVCCNIDESHMSRIFVQAVYKSNYDGVENILKNSYLSKIKSKCLFYPDVDNNEAGYRTVLDSYHIAREDKQMIELLEKYNISSSSDPHTVFCQPTPLIMACLAGNSDAINHDIRGNKINIRRALNIVVACDYEKCMQQLMHNLSDEFEDLFARDEERLILGRKLLRRACVNKSCKVLKILLDDGPCDKNEIVNDFTLLDEVLERAKNNNSFDSVVALLKTCGAKTAEQIIAEDAADAKENWYIPLAWQ